MILSDLNPIYFYIAFCWSHYHITQILSLLILAVSQETTDADHLTQRFKDLKIDKGTPSNTKVYEIKGSTEKIEKHLAKGKSWMSLG